MIYPAWHASASGSHTPAKLAARSCSCKLRRQLAALEADQQPRLIGIVTILGLTILGVLTASSFAACQCSLNWPPNPTKIQRVIVPLAQIDGLVGSSQAEAEEKTSETVIQKIFDELPVP
jgi:mannose/fructose/N-acetylgalactosamine-specific phosphotransferase system component IID